MKDQNRPDKMNEMDADIDDTDNAICLLESAGKNRVSESHSCRSEGSRCCSPGHDCRRQGMSKITRDRSTEREDGGSKIGSLEHVPSVRERLALLRSMLLPITVNKHKKVLLCSIVVYFNAFNALLMLIT